MFGIIRNITMYLHQAMNRARGKTPTINRMGHMNQVSKTMSGKLSEVKRIGNMPSMGKQYTNQN